MLSPGPKAPTLKYSVRCVPSFSHSMSLLLLLSRIVSISALIPRVEMVVVVCCEVPDGFVTTVSVSDDWVSIFLIISVIVPVSPGIRTSGSTG